MNHRWHPVHGWLWFKAKTTVMDIQRPPNQTSTWNVTQPTERVPVGVSSSGAYATRKTVAQGMLDFALLMANASQLKTLLTSTMIPHNVLFFLTLTLIGISILMQIIVGIVIVILGSMDVNTESEHMRANRLNNASVGLILMITIVNVFIAAFGLDH